MYRNKLPEATSITRASAEEPTDSIIESDWQVQKSMELNGVQMRLQLF